MKISRFLSKPFLFLVNRQKSRRFIHFFLRFFQPRRDTRINVRNQIIYARSFDRIIALYLRKFSLMEAFETQLFRSIVKENMTVIDIGANLGYYTLIAASLVGKGGMVFSFEPAPENFSLLLKNIKANGYQNIEALNLAVCEKSGREKLFLCEEHQGEHRIYDPGGKRRQIFVSSVSLDDFLKARPRVDVIKIDIQGAEGRAFSGMQNIIKANPQLSIITEFWPEALEMAGMPPEDFLKMIASFNFQIYLINEEKKQLERINGQVLLKERREQNYVNLFLKKSC